MPRQGRGQADRALRTIECLSTGVERSTMQMQVGVLEQANAGRVLEAQRVCRESEGTSETDLGHQNGQ